MFIVFPKIEKSTEDFNSFKPFEYSDKMGRYCLGVTTQSVYFSEKVKRGETCYNHALTLIK